MSADEDILAWFFRGPLTGDPRLAEITAMGAVGAVLRCAREVGIISAQRFSTWHADLLGQLPGSAAPQAKFYDRDFSGFVPASAPVVRNAAELIRDIPLGSFIAFVVVDKPPPGSTQGLRHLLHLMLSLGDGWAIGVGNHAAGLAEDRWQLIDLADGLKWLAPGTAAHDTLETSNAAGINRPARIHYIPPPGHPLPRSLAWGTPDPARQNALIQAIVAAGSTPPFIFLETSKDRPGFFRPSLQVRLPQRIYRDFFNSPNGMRGAYFADPVGGDTFTRTILDQIAIALTANLAAIPIMARDPSGALINHTLPPVIAGILPDAFRHGKIWPVLDLLPPPLGRRVFWGQSWANPGWQCVPNRAWVNYPDTVANNARYTAVMNGFFGEPFVAGGMAAVDATTATQLGVTPATLPPAKTFRQQIIEKARLDLYRLGACFQFEFSNDAQGWPNVDVKGAWMDQTGAIGNFDPPVKFARNYQIKWFGLT